MFRTVFSEVKMNIPFFAHPNIVKMQTLNGAEMGVHHFDKNGAQKMLQNMSAHMHRLLLQHMISKNLPFSIILDGSSDNTDTHYMIIYFQILQNDIPSVVFYRLVQTTSDVTAQGYFKSITAVMTAEEIDIYSYLNLVGYISDGRNTMTGEKGGLISFFQKITENPLYPVHCMAHRLHLSIIKLMQLLHTSQNLINS